MLLTESKLNQILTSKSCKNDDECKYFDCDSRCNNSTGFCSLRVNDNIEVNYLITFENWFIYYKQILGILSKTN